jgi:hypothetical protein
MDTSVTLIGLAITLLIVIPVALILRSNITNTNKIKGIKKQNSQNGHYAFEETETSNKKIFSIDSKNKGLLFIDFSYKGKETVYFADLKNIILCSTIVTKENNSRTISKVEIELVHKDSMKKETIPIYDIENHFLDFNCLYEDHKFAVKWTNIISDSLV